MSSVNIQGDKKNPTIQFDVDRGYLNIEGRSNLENPARYYRPVIDALEEYFDHPQPETRARFAMEYFNSSSSKMIMKTFRLLEKLQVDGKSNVKVEWCYDEGDGSMLEAGEDYMSMLKLDFEMIELSE